ncbi:MAG: inositol monophosphatase family protein [Actinomycetota bacterium]
MHEEERRLRDLAVELARQAGQMLLSMKPGEIRSKTSPTDPATDADRAAEKLIFDRLREARPDDTIVAEEGAANTGSSGVQWIVDPLDGTVNYVYGIPQWCVSIGVEGAYRFGVIYDPNRDEMFSEPADLTPSSQTELPKALIATGFGYAAEDRARQAQVAGRVIPKVRDIRRAGSCALDLAWVASGRLDGYWEQGVKRWDTSAGLALVEQAGGFILSEGNLTMAAGTEELLQSLREAIR